MPRTYIKAEGFEFIESRIAKTGHGVTAAEFAEKFSIQRGSAASWLSKWASKGYLKWQTQKRVNGGYGRPVGVYYIDENCRWWGELVYNEEWG